MLFEELDPRHGLWDEDGESSESEEEEVLGSDWAGHRGCLRGLGHVAGSSSPPAGPGPTTLPQARACSPAGQGHSLSTRTLSHPSFYPYYAALSRSAPGTHPVPHGDWPQGSGLQGGPAIGSGLLLPISSSEFFYTDPLMPPGHRVYNYLSHPSQQVCQSVRLSTPDPIMSVREASPPPCFLPRSGMKWISQAEYNAVSALLELPYEEPACNPGEGSPRTQLLLSAVEPEYGRVVTQEAANVLLSLHSSPDTLGELLEGPEPPALPHGLGSVMLGAFFPHGAAGEPAL
ncbi:Histone deacetylase complex subunit SAP25 [Chelonia mydas]|uniref:Histone deacetylase complex subunit SAP25 n=1 Tax=Chelonia mydas TaxID=8469 RepID=M7AXA9_CHEMY|nr:Histone deacetylase complex subunit SAP25 [Chelonia mydas]